MDIACPRVNVCFGSKADIGAYIINVCFAVKRWPEPEQWVRIVKDELGLDCCQFSFDLVDPLLDEGTTMAYADAVRELAAARNIFIHSAFTGLAAYSWSQLLHPHVSMREAATRWYERAIDFTARLGASATNRQLARSDSPSRCSFLQLLGWPKSAAFCSNQAGNAC